MREKPRSPSFKRVHSEGARVCVHVVLSGVCARLLGHIGGLCVCGSGSCSDYRLYKRRPIGFCGLPF